MGAALVARVFDTQANQRLERTFDRFPVRIGRNQLNDLHLDRPYISQFHAALDVRDGRVFVRDLGSTNGTVHKGARLQRDTPLDITTSPEFSIGPILMQLQLGEAQPEAPPMVGQAAGSLLDDPLAGRGRVTPGAEDPYVRQLAPYIEAYRASWTAVYRVIYDHLSRVPAELRSPYLRRIGVEYPGVGAEADFQKLAQYYGVEARAFVDLGPAHAAHAALLELVQKLAPGTKVDDVNALLTFAKRLRDSMEVFLRCFVSLRNGHREFEAEVLGKSTAGDTTTAVTVRSAKDAAELGSVLLALPSSGDSSRELQEIFVDVMSHQVALMNGVMEGVRSLLSKLSPKAIEDDYDRRGKKTGLFSNRYEALWRQYETRHGDYSGEDKETFLIIFGPQFTRAYAAAAGEENAPRFPQPGAPPPPKR
jgi:type VI secretion system protein ImpI